MKLLTVLVAVISNFNVLVFSFLLSACSSAYIPSPKNVPLFEKKGEVQIEAGASTNSLFLTGSYAFSEKYALIGSGSMTYCHILGRPLGPHGELSIYPVGDVPHRSIEAGLGRYNLFPSSEWRLEVFAGTGYGAAHSFFSDGNKQHYFQGFIQINTGKRYKHVELGWSLRTAYSGLYSQNLCFRCFSGTCGYFIEHENYQVFHLEPLFVVRTGGQHLKASFRTGFGLAFPSVDERYLMLHLSVGLSYRFF
jgi:hypothetical protein